MGVVKSNEVQVRLADVSGAMAVLDRDFALLDISPTGRAMLARVGLDTSRLPVPLPTSFADELRSAPIGESLFWRPEEAELCIGCTRYTLGSKQYLLVMRELSTKQRRLWERLHRQRLESMGRLVASIVHELRAPLGSLSLNASILGRPDLHAERATALEDVQESIERLKRTIDVLLDYARIGPPVRHVMSVRDALGGVRQLLRTMLSAGSHELTTEVAPDAEWTTGNRLVVEQILINLVLNSVEAAPGAARIDVRCERVGDRVSITLCDQGPGIPVSLRSKLFSHFVSTKLEGTGIGLATAREAARSLGGDLRYQPTEIGACFVLELPAAEPPTRAGVAP